MIMPQVDIVLTQDFPILSLTLVTEPLRVANRELAKAVWQWRMLSIDGGVTASSSGIGLQTDPLDEQASDIVLLLSSYRPETALVKPVLSWLRRKARSGAMMGCVDTGAMIFAEAGLLTRVPAAVHFEALRGYRERYANQLFVDRMHDVTENRCSSAGGVATIEMTLGLIEHFCGRELAVRVAEILTYRPSGFSGSQQKMAAGTSLMQLDRKLATAVDLMLAHVQSPLPVSLVAKRVDVAEWTLARLFKRYLKQTPAAYYRRIRLNHARNLIRNSGHRIGEIGSLCGFDNPESFSRAYRKEYGISASHDRAQTTGPG